MNNTAHAAVLDSFSLTWVDATDKLQRVHTNPAFNFGEICQLGITYNLRNIWIVPGSTVSEDIVDNPADWIAYPKVDYSANVTKFSYGRVQYPAACFIHRTEGSWDDKRTVSIFIPQVDARWKEDRAGGWELAQCEDAITLLGSLKYLHEQVKVDIQSPGYTGIEMMKATVPADKVVRADLSMLPDFSEGDILWERELTPDEKAMKYKHICDRNSMYLAAATGAELGVGTPRHIMCGGTERPNFRKPGVWQLGFRHIPDVFKFGETPILDGDLQWMYSPMIQALLDMGCELWPVKGYQWDTSSRALQPWGKGLWDSRQLLKNPSPQFKNDAARINAYMMIKRIATQSVGWLDITSERTKQVKSPWFRPDWKNQIVSLARARMLLKIYELYQKHGVIPAKIKTDEITYYSNEPSAQVFLPELFVRFGELGSFKYETVQVN